MQWLTTRPLWLTVIAWPLLAVLFAALSRLVVRSLVPAREHDDVHSIVTPLMTALGAAFAVLIGLTLVNEAGYLRSAQDNVSNEAAAASRLAWAATTPGVQTERIHSALLTYLQATRAHEWHALSPGQTDDPTTAAAIAGLERTVRAVAARPSLGTPTSNELLASLDAVTSARRTRTAAAERQIPTLYIVTLIVSGAALIANAAAVTFRSSARASLLVGGLAIVVGLSLSLLFAISRPFNGAIAVSGHPLDTIVRQLKSGFFTI